jgi:hypothetical protein
MTDAQKDDVWQRWRHRESLINSGRAGRNLAGVLRH